MRVGVRIRVSRSFHLEAFFLHVLRDDATQVAVQRACIAHVDGLVRCLPPLMSAAYHPLLTWLAHVDGRPQRVVGRLDQVLGLRVDVAHTEGLVQVRVHAVEDRRDVDVDDVAVLQPAQARR